MTLQERAKELKANGLSLRAITKQLKQEGYKTSRGTPPSPFTVSKMLKKQQVRLVEFDIPSPRTVALLLVPADRLQETLDEVYRK